MSKPSWRKRTRGTRRQIGKPFRVDKKSMQGKKRGLPTVKMVRASVPKGRSKPWLKRFPPEMRVKSVAGRSLAPPTIEQVWVILHNMKTISVYSKGKKLGQINPKDLEYVGTPRTVRGRDNVPFWRATTRFTSMLKKSTTSWDIRGNLVRPRIGSIHKPRYGRIKIEI